jgi:hypothetical protein
MVPEIIPPWAALTLGARIITPMSKRTPNTVLFLHTLLKHPVNFGDTVIIPPHLSSLFRIYGSILVKMRQYGLFHPLLY